jgi:hypothetical protein
MVPTLVVDSRVDGSPPDEICTGVSADDAEAEVDDA